MVDARAPRETDTREKTVRRKPWTRPSSLDAPPPPEGYVHRWIRSSYANIDDKKNLSARLREGFELVRAEEYPDFEAPTVQDGRHAGVIGVGGLLLARFPLETLAERTAYFSQVTGDQMKGVDNSLMKEQNAIMPISKDRSSRVTFGGHKENAKTT